MSETSKSFKVMQLNESIIQESEKVLYKSFLFTSCSTSNFSRSHEFLNAKYYFFRRRYAPPAIAATPIAGAATVPSTVVAATLCMNAKPEPATTFPIPAWIPAAIEPPTTPPVVKPAVQGAAIVIPVAILPPPSIEDILLR
jgi:hypothetical protein